MEQMMRKYPVGIQTFERIIKEGFIYVDKTDLIWQMAHYANLDLSSTEGSSTAQEPTGTDPGFEAIECL